MSYYSEELHRTYNSTVSLFEKAYPLCTKDLMRQIDTYSRACALYIWNMLNVDISGCTDDINAIYSDASGLAPYTGSDLRIAKNKLSEGNRHLSVPRFFNDIISYDVSNNSNISRRLAECFQLFNISYAMIVEEIPEKVLDAISKLYSEMQKACDEKNVSPSKEIVDPHTYATPISKEELIVTARSNKDYTQPTIPEHKPITKKEEKEPLSQAKSKGSTSSFEDLEKLIGLSKAKQEIREISDFAKIQKARKDQGLPTSEVSFHLVFTGNPGTGKTTVARLVAKIYKELGIVSKGHLIEVSAKDLIAGYVGQTAIKTGEVIEKALGGVLFIDEAYTLLDKGGQGFGQEAIDTLLKEMEDKRDDLAIIVAGYDELMKDFISSNPGLKSRFNKYVHFDDYTAEEMYAIFCSLCDNGAYYVSEDAKKLIEGYFNMLCSSKDRDFANGRTVRNVFEQIISKQASRISSIENKTKEVLSTIEAEDIQNCIGKITKEESLEDVMAEFDSLVGLDMAKEEIKELLYIVQNQQRRKAQGLKVPSLSLHLVFMGNPGTGKTTIARCVARIYKCLGLLSKGHLIETDRSGLVAGYVGQTAIKTQDVIQSAIGGVLFIDEAYTLSNGNTNDFGQEAIDTLLKAMEDRREDFVVIVAGYDDLMNSFIHSNPGLESRFNRYIHFEDYTPEQMYSIFESLCTKNQYSLDREAAEKLMMFFKETDIAKLGNGRGARNLFEKVVTQQARRLELSSEDNDNEDLQAIIASDIDMVIRRR